VTDRTTACANDSEQPSEQHQCQIACALTSHQITERLGIVPKDSWFPGNVALGCPWRVSVHLSSSQSRALGPGLLPGTLTWSAESSGVTTTHQTPKDSVSSSARSSSSTHRTLVTLSRHCLQKGLETPSTLLCNRPGRCSMVKSYSARISTQRARIPSGRLNVCNHFRLW